ncbi:anthranilate synthase component I family protein [Gorillibacterium massiliense]|uniref:anthranilate synthase component I family protein n=1 Tax=Gorillibacterium massiliense TaxID=1280390 RepID=UPI0012DF6619|nr:anthranilate synthase component I family protein [Gorillibacterium massiliense]
MLPYVQGYDLKEGETLPTEWSGLWRIAGNDEAFVWESGKDGRYTFFGFSPASVIQGKGNHAVIREKGMRLKREGKPLDVVREWMAPYRSPQVDGLPKWLGGCAGFFGYDLVRSLERLPMLAAEDGDFAGFPDYAFMRIERLWIIDHRESRLFCAVHQSVPRSASENPGASSASTTDEAQLSHLFAESRAAADEMKRLWDEIIAAGREPSAMARYRSRQKAVRSGEPPGESLPLSRVKRAFDEPGFVSAVRRIQDYIRAGDVFQVNLSVRQTFQLHSSPEAVYEWLRVVNPSPYMGMLRFPDYQLVSASPELLVQKEGARLRTRPIAGTRRRGLTPEDDGRLATELAESEKERAEHIMLVDLERNDLGKICEYGTVKVDELMAIERYSHVMHLVSEVSGTLAAGKDAFDVIAAVFPGGTITGAPKVRTMEIIEELEPVRRGPYTGSMGWIDYNGNMELNIVIRTLAVAGGNGHLQAGAGIVIDSVPEREYRESISKAKAVWQAVQWSESEIDDGTECNSETP